MEGAGLRSRSFLLGSAEDILLCVDSSAEMGEPFGENAGRSPMQYTDHEQTVAD